MEQQAALSEIARLEALVAADAGAPGFPALAEANRRAGRLKEAERVARDGLRHDPASSAGRVALALALIDLGSIDEARTELARVLEDVPDHPLARSVGDDSSGVLSDLGDAELDDAFADAESRPDEMVDANDVAQAAVAAAALDTPEGVLAPASQSPFATETMASLLDEQGHREEARELRDQISVRFEPEPEPEPEREPEAANEFQPQAQLDPEPEPELQVELAPQVRLDAPAAAGEPGLGDEIRLRVIATLEHWLEKLRREPR